MSSSNIPQKVQEVIGKVLTDPQFASELQQKGLAAIRAGAGSQEWNDYFYYFASSPGELKTLGATQASSCTCNSATYTTLSTLVTPVPTCCGATTTTTTSTN